MAAPLADDAPRKPETVVAYAGAALATLVWVGCVIPGATLADPLSNDEAATPLYRGAILLLPALFLYITGSVGTTLAAGPTALRAALAAGDGFVTLYVAGALAWTRGSDPALVTIVALLIVVGFLSLKEAVRVVTNSGEATEDDAALPVAGRRWSDLRLALAILVLVAPASLLSHAGSERASLLAPFVYVAISAGGARLARTTRGLRLTAALLMAVLAGHVTVAIHFVLVRGEPPVSGISSMGNTTVGIAAGVFVLSVAHAVLLARRRQGATPA